MAANTKSSTANGGGGGWPQRVWERMFSIVLILIAIVAAILLFLVILRPYCQCRDWTGWWAGDPCPCAPVSSVVVPTDWNQDALLYCRKQLNNGGYGSTSEVTDMQGATTQGPMIHERLFGYQAPNSQEVYFFLAVQGSSYSDPSYGGFSENAVKLEVRYSELSAFGFGQISCSGPRLIADNSSPSTSYGSTGSDRTWGWYCRVAPPQNGFPGPGAYSYYRAIIKNNSPTPFRYCYVAVCDRKWPKNDKCTDPAVALQIQGPQGGRGYPSSPGYSPPYGGSGYPGSSYPGSSYPSGGSSYPSSSSSYPTTPGPTSSSPPPSSTGTGGN